MKPPATNLRWLAEHLENGTTAFRIGRDGDEVIAEWIGIGCLVARRDGSESRFDVEPDAHPREVEKIQRGSARLLLRQLAGRLALHGAAVAIGRSAVVLLGRAGHGKSTLAASLCANANVALFADDAVAIDREGSGWFVSPLESNHLLDRGAIRAIHGSGSDDDEPGKSPVPATRVGEGVAQVVAFVDLTFDETCVEPQLRRVSGIEAVSCLVPQAVRFVLDEPALHTRELDTFGALVESVPTFKLTRARRLDLLEHTNKLILPLLGTDRHAPPHTTDP